MVWQDKAEGAERTVDARLGDSLRLKWEERRALGPGGWASSGGRLRLYALPPWGQGRGGPVVNWNLVRWLDIRCGGQSWLQSLRAAGACEHPSSAIADVFWSVPDKAGGGLVHARFMRRKADGLLFLRLALPTSGGKPVTLHLSARAYDLCLGRYWENVVHTRAGRHVTCRSLDGKETITPWRAQADPQAPAAIWTRAIDAYHGGVGVLYDPATVARLSMERPGGDRAELPLCLMLKSEARVVHLAFWDYRRLGGASAFARLAAMAPLHAQVKADASWQQTRAEQVLDRALLARAPKLLDRLALTPERRSACQELLQSLSALARHGDPLASAGQIAAAYADQHRLRQQLIAARMKALEELRTAFRQGRLRPPPPADDWDAPADLELEE